MAGALKQEFIEAVRLTPDGIDAFLETPLPAVSSLVGPADDTATEALSAHLLKIFDALAGLTLVELLLRIGQHNSVLESAMIAGLEYLQESDSDEHALQFVEPTEGGNYSPGEMRFTVSIKNGIAGRVTLSVDGSDPVKLSTITNGQTWFGYQTITATGEHSAECSAEFEAGDLKTATVNFTITDSETEPPPPGEPEPEPPGGDDDEALERLKNAILVEYRGLLSFGNLGDPDEYKTRMARFTAVVSQFLSAVKQTGSAVSAYKQRIDELLAQITTILNRSPLTTTDLEDATSAATAIVNNINAIMAMVV